LIKLLLVGDSGVGKSSVLLRFSDDTFTDSFISTIGVDFKIRTIELDNKVHKLQIWDTAGQERFRTITSSYYRGCAGVFICYDITSRQSFDNVRTWNRDVQQYAASDVCVALVGMKSDLESKRAVSTEEGEQLANSFGFRLFFETSAKQNVKVDVMFYELARAISEKNK